MKVFTQTRPSEVVKLTAVLNSTHLSQAEITLHELRGENRVDSRLIAQHLGVQHHSVFRLIKAYADDFREFGVIGFQIHKPSRGSVGGKPERYALLNEDQAYLLLTYSRNMKRVRRLKIRLVKAFHNARNHRAIHEAYLPGYHELQETVKTLARRAKGAGSQTDESVFYMNANKLVNKTTGIEAGTRHPLDWLQKLKVMNVQVVVQQAIQDAIQAGRDHKAAYCQAKEAARRFADSARLWLDQGQA